VRPPIRLLTQKLDLLRRDTPDFFSLTLWPPNSPDLSPVDYKVWSTVQEKVYKERIKDVDELRSSILAAWDELINALLIYDNQACVKGKGKHFEHKLHVPVY